MTYFPMDEYILLGYRKSKKKYKKYDAILQKKTNKLISYVPFGDDRYEQYRDKLGNYSSSDHLDKKRRQLFRKRHIGFIKKGMYSPAYFSYNILW